MYCGFWNSVTHACCSLEEQEIPRLRLIDSGAEKNLDYNLVKALSVKGQRVLLTLSHVSRTITYLFTSRTHGIVSRLS